MGIARSILALLLLTACSSPSFVDAGKGSASPNALTNEVVYKIHAGFDDPKPDCVAVLPFKAGDGISAKEAETIRSAVYQHLAPRVREVPLADVDRLAGDPESLHCAAVIEGTVTDYQTLFLGVVSHVDVGADLRMRRLADGKVIWEGRHIASSIDGGVPLDPLSAVAGLVSALTNVRGEQAARLTDDLARRLVFTIPSMKLPTLAGADAAPAPTVASAADWFERGRAALAAQDFAKAHADFVRAIALDGSNPKYRDGLAVACAASGQAESALAAYRMAVALDPGDGFAWYNTGILQFNAGDTDAAVEAFRRSGDAYLAKGDRERAGQAADRLHDIAATTHSGDHT